MSQRARMRIIAATAVLGSLSVGSAAWAVGQGHPNGGGPSGTGPPGYTGIYTPCPQASPQPGYTSRPCGDDKAVAKHK
jgi:hypothetical protein